MFLYSSGILGVYAISQNQQMGDVYSTIFLDLILDKDKYKLSLEFDAIFWWAVDRSIAYMPSILAFLKLIFPFLNIILL